MEFIEILADQIRHEVESEIRAQYSNTTYDLAPESSPETAKDDGTENRNYHPDLDLYLSLHSTSRQSPVVDTLVAKRKGARAYQIEPRQQRAPMPPVKPLTKPLKEPLTRQSTQADFTRSVDSDRPHRSISQGEQEALFFFNSLGMCLDYEKASVPELKNAFKQLALSWHPDRHSTSSQASTRSSAASTRDQRPPNEVFAQLLVSYKLLYKIWMGVHL